MTTANPAEQQPFLEARDRNLALSGQWRSLRRSATFVALISAPAAFIWMVWHTHLPLGWAIAIATLATFAFRGALDLAFRRFLPWPSLFATDDPKLREDDVVNRRRAWFWRQKYRLAFIFISLFVAIWFVELIFGHHNAPWTIAAHIVHSVGKFARNPQYLTLFVQLPIFFLFNFLIFMGPMMLMGISQIRGFEPGDANWGVSLDDVRGQAEAKEEVRRIVNLWSSGEAFEKAGGRRERGILFHGAPGTGKTTLAKAIATGFNSPFVSIPGSGFAQAQPLDAKILTPRGWTTMGAIEVGDEVIDPEGGTARVIGVFPQGERDIYRVRFSDGSSTECDLDHLWQIRRDRRRPWHVEQLGSIKEKLQADSRQNRPYIPLVQNLEFEAEELPLDPYLLGVLLGDGCFTSTTPSLIAEERELVGASAARLPEGMTAEEPLTTTLRSLGLDGHGALTTFVPDTYKFASAETRLEVLRGLMDTDGRIRQDERSEAIIDVRSRALAEDVVFLAQSLGGTATTERTARGWQVQVALGPDCNPFRLERKAACWNRAWDPSRRMVAIEKVGRKQAQCIKLDS